jgi:FixJ family two-component response regulator
MSESVSQIYVVDDDLSVRESVGRLIKSAGLNVRTFATAQEILGNLGQEMPSCLLLDIQLPGWSKIGSSSKVRSPWVHTQRLLTRRG